MSTIRYLLFFSLCFYSLGFDYPDDSGKKIYISTDFSGMDVIGKTKIPIHSQFKGKNLSVVEVDEKYIHEISHLMHKKLGRCGGFFYEDRDSFNLSMLDHAFERSFLREIPLQISQEQTVKPMILKVKAEKIEQTITHLSNFRNRYYKSPHGVASQEYLKSTWESFFQDRDDVTASLINHSSWDQPSVMLHIEGVEKPEEIVVIGGHGDSIAGWFPNNEVHAPGADDNASGVSTITEIIRVIAEQDYRPKRSLRFYSYAAEEVGLRGSKEIAENMRSDDARVVGVMQLDMTNFKGGPENLVFITDNTDSSLTQFTQELVARYLPELSVSNDRCGYACSDHASWTRNGYRSVFPFESMTNVMNRKIHTANDTISQSQGNAQHASNFAKLGVAFMVELGSGNSSL